MTETETETQRHRQNARNRMTEAEAGPTKTETTRVRDVHKNETNTKRETSGKIQSLTTHTQRMKTAPNLRRIGKKNAQKRCQTRQEEKKQNKNNPQRRQQPAEAAVGGTLFTPSSLTHIPLNKHSVNAPKTRKTRQN